MGPTLIMVSRMNCSLSKTPFFELLGNDLIASVNEAHEKGELSISQRRGLITSPIEDGVTSRSFKLETNNTAKCGS